MANDKKYRCEKCGRPINHKGNCLRCNLIEKRHKEDNLGLPIEEILKIKTLDHKEVQLQLQSIFKSQGYFVELEKKVRARRPGKIDVYAKKNNFSVGVEIDHSTIRLKSIDKLNTLRPNLAIFILKSRNVNTKKNKSRLGLIKVKSLVIYLSKRKVQSLSG